jgi:pimeloyl-ACP methyl ester carboxylesterase
VVESTAGPLRGSRVAGTPFVSEVAGIHWTGLTWGLASDPPLLLVHGLASNAGTFWRLGPVLATGRHVVAVDLPGHGGTRPWRGRHRLDATARALGAFIRAIGFDRTDLVVVAHSWGAMVASRLPAAGIRPARLVLLDPPARSREELEAVTHDPTEVSYTDARDAYRAVREGNSTWTERDVEAKAAALCQLDAAAAREILTRNGDWDAGLAALTDRRADGVSVWVIRGDPETGGMVPDAVASKLAARIGRDHLVTIPGCGHSPHRTHFEATIHAFREALTPGPGRTPDRRRFRGGGLPKAPERRAACDSLKAGETARA